ncbi:thiamine phosphate synthase [Salinisphaera sp. Q1T1-3]|uniref:thiamine phosphate synthase n=1 Tax=Salinisphaera sp. Q1T1-3 TaxID=2321229 RepID=UPI000E7467FD|nr:thiamine phosphate synthase [Salinisphaera sp. Q1T1-3]RJS94349.1 thiamine phosphate synthase [Salinisphaera sp. Q1T1-3]
MNTRGVYAIYDRASLPDDRLDHVNDILAAGVVWLQYRDKREQAPDRALIASLQSLCRAHGALFIVNDDWRLAADIGADGVHLGQSDGDPTAARRALGPDARIGVSCQDRIPRAEAALAAGADHVSFGRFFTSQTKPDAPGADPAVLGAARRLGAPVVAIGGITAANAGTLIAAGADLIAVSGALFHAEAPGTAASALGRLFPAVEPDT